MLNLIGVQTGKMTMRTLKPPGGKWWLYSFLSSAFLDIEDWLQHWALERLQVPPELSFCKYFLHTNYAGLNNGPLIKGAHLLIPGTCECVTFQW